MRTLVMLSAVFLAGCPAAILLGMATSGSKGQPEGPLRTPTVQDYGAWTGVPKVQLETHRQFAVVPREVRRISDGSELWILRVCPPKWKNLEECCLHQFVIADGAVTQYRSLGPCGVDCNARPEPKIQACVTEENRYKVPDGYR